VLPESRSVDDGNMKQGYEGGQGSQKKARKIARGGSENESYDLSRTLEKKKDSTRAEKRGANGPRNSRKSTKRGTALSSAFLTASARPESTSSSGRRRRKKHREDERDG